MTNQTKSNLLIWFKNPEDLQNFLKIYSFIKKNRNVNDELPPLYDSVLIQVLGDAIQVEIKNTEWEEENNSKGEK